MTDQPPKTPPSDNAAGIGRGTGAIQVGHHVNVHYGDIVQTAALGLGADELRRAYLGLIVSQAEHLPQFAGDSGAAQIQLSAVYTALLTQRREANSTEDSSARLDVGSRYLSALDVANGERKLVLLGGPGSGKSTFVNFVASAMANELLGAGIPNLATLMGPVNRATDDDGNLQPQCWGHGALLPVRVVLRDLAAQLPPSGTRIDAALLWNFIQRRLDEATLTNFVPILHQELLEKGGLILLDGLDEVPDALDRREQVKQAVQQFATTFSHCRYLVTSRAYAYQRQDWKLDGFTEAQLLPFTPAQIKAFVDAWYSHMSELARLSATDAADRAALLKHEIDRNERIRELAERPLLLTLIAQLQTERGGKLPEKREELYDKAVDMLLNVWERMKRRDSADGSATGEPSLTEYLNAGHDAIRKQLNRLAFEAHRDQPQLVGTADIRQDALINALLKASSRADVQPRRLEEYLRDRAGILSAHRIGMYQFPHRSFQEYLAACHLTDDDFPDTVAKLACHDPARWREVVLLAGAKAARGSASSVWLLSETLCSKQLTASHGEADHWGALFAGCLLIECDVFKQVARRDESKLACIRAAQQVIMRHAVLPAIERALAGRTLAALGDERAEVMTLHGMQFCAVPPGPFVMSDEGNVHEKPQHSVDIAYPYFMARFPVSRAQWREYLETGGHAPGDQTSVHGRDNEPVTYVSWLDARRFCEFLTQTWQSWLPEGFIVTLPSEAEWEKAARGGAQIPREVEYLTATQLAAKSDETLMPNPAPHRHYPWGDEFDADRANTISIGETSALGCYLAGASPYGCEEMGGNVWEWTRSLWGKNFMKPDYQYPYQIEDRQREDLNAPENIYRVVRGGSWIDPPVNVRVACRLRNRPVNRLNYLGFRVLLRSSPVYP